MAWSSKTDQAEWPAGKKVMQPDEYSDHDMVLDSSVDRFGNVPVRAETGVWRAALFVIFIEFAERLSYFGLATNLIIYLTKVMHQDITTAAKNVNYWTGVTTMMPLVGGLVADSYLGRFYTVLLSSLLYLLGLGLLTMSEFTPGLKPCLAEESSSSSCQAETVNRRHEALFFTAMYLISVATGGHKPALESFGADQFDGDHPEERRKKMSYFNWWNAALCAGLVLGVTCVVYIQDYVGWGVADVVLTVTMAVGLVIFCVGRPCYRYRMPEGSPLTPLLQVLVAAAAKRHLPLPSNPAELHEIPASSGKKLLCHTSYLSCLDKAAVIEVEQKGSSSSSNSSGDGDPEEGMAIRRRQPWRLATVTQVEEAKLVVGAIPVWLTTQMFGLCVAQASTFFIKQGSTMDRRIGSGFEIPPASIFSLGAIGMLVSVTFYDKLLVPFLRRSTGNERGVSILQRIGIGMALSIVAMSTAAVVERKRRLGAAAEGTAAPMSVFWLAPQYLVLGVADGFALVGLQEYFYEQVPEGMRSVGIAFYLSVLGAANFLSSALITVVDHATRRTKAGSWFAKDLNRSRLDYFYWLLAALNGVNLCVYVHVSSRCSSVHMNKKKKVACAESGEGTCGGADDSISS